MVINGETRQRSPMPDVRSYSYGDCSASSSLEVAVEVGGRIAKTREIEKEKERRRETEAQTAQCK